MINNCRLSGSSLIHIVVRLRAVRSGLVIPGMERDSSLLQTVHTDPTAHLVSYSMGSGSSIPDVMWPECEFNH